jgi:hypothetical protein
MNAERLEELLRKLETRIAKAGWDQDPELWLIPEDGDPVPTPVFAMLPDRDMRPPDILAWFAERVSESGILSREAPPEDLAGWAFIHEGWIVNATTEGADDVLTAAHRHQLHKHPARQEVRLLAASVRGFPIVDVLVSRGRGQEVESMTTVSGYIFESLHTLVAALG